MEAYDSEAKKELEAWISEIRREPTLLNAAARKIQGRINNLIPEKVHGIITSAIERMVKTVLVGAEFTRGKVRAEGSLFLREAFVRERIGFYQKAASAEGAVTGAGGILFGLADFPALIALKIKLLFDISGNYGWDARDYRERLFILHIFQLAFSGGESRRRVLERILRWEEYVQSIPDNVEGFDWRQFQQEYRDFIDLAKMAQLLPVIGAAVGAVANYKLVSRLGTTAINCYRIRFFGEQKGGKNLTTV